ncbi:MAG: lysophospholipid acyltransferase family protein [Crocinitomicaceae bacterium]|nr:lysophospholipid acyltransferase family protein [Crocinitomicaceae bacterium]
MNTLLNKLSEDSYHTDAHYKRAFIDKAALGSSLYFNTCFISKLFRNRRIARTGKFDTQEWVNGSLNIMELIERCGGKFHIEGMNNMDKIEGSAVFISNHMSILESMIFPGLIAARKEVTFVVKDSLVTHPLFGPVMRARKPIAVERKDPIVDFKKVMNEGYENLQNGTSVVIFPQSARMTKFDPKKFNKLGIKLAKKAKVQIIPIAIKTDFWKNGKRIKDIGKIDRETPIHIKFGEPFRIEGSGNNEHQKVIDFITENLSNWQE